MSALTGIGAYQWQSNLMAYSSSGMSSTNTSDVTGYGAITDSLDISAASIEKYSSMWIMDELYGVSEQTINGQYKTLGTVADELTAELSGFTQLAGSIFSLSSSSDPITLQATGTGSLNQVDEDGNGSSLNVSSSALTSDFMLCAARAAILKGASDIEGFEEDYNNDPAACMEKYEDQLKEYMLSYQITLSGQGATTGFASSTLSDTEEV